MKPVASNRQRTSRDRLQEQRTAAWWRRLFGLLLWAVGACITVPITITIAMAAAEPAATAARLVPEKVDRSSFDHDSLPLTAGTVLVMVGLMGVVVVLVHDRRRLCAEHDKLQVRVAELSRNNQELDTRLGQQRQKEEIPQKEPQDNDRRYQALVRSAPVGIFLTDAQGDCVFVNDRWCQLAGLTAEQAAGTGWLRALYPDDYDRFVQAWQRAIEAQTEFVAEHRFRNPSGQIAWLNTRAVPLRDREGRMNGYLGANTDIADLKRTEEILRASEARFRGYFELPLVGIALTGPDKRWLEANNRLCEMLGYSREELRQLSWAELIYPEDLDAEVAKFERVMSRSIDGYVSDLMRFIRKDGAILYVSMSCRCMRRSTGMVDYFVMVLQDITERRQAEEKIQYLTGHDVLTGLTNRILFGDRLEQAVRRASRDRSQVGVMLVDLDRFKVINDTLGHTLGDCLLQEVATRLGKCVRQCDTISRQGGDEFSILLPDLGSPNDVAVIAQRILVTVAEPYQLEGHELHVNCSVGISLYPRDGRSVDNLLKHADIALYRAKDMGRNNFQFYLSGMTVRSFERLTLETSLRYAVEREELMVYYQPKWNFRAGVISGAEALVRWHHAELGWVPPARFIPIAEENGLVLPLGEWVLRAAVREIGELHRGGFPDLRVAVNLSARQVRQADLVGLVCGLLAETGFTASCLELELTESILMQDIEDNITTLRMLKAMGGRIAIDDFGTGYSSLSYLKRFPVDVLKIDRAFVSDILTNDSDVAIVDAIVTLARGLKLEVVAEGVETAEQAAFLQTHGCDEGQGFYFGRPLPLAEFKELLAQDWARAAAVAAPPAG